MLSFTNKTKATQNNWIVNQPTFQPIIITNKLPRQVSPKKQQKLIRKVSQGKSKFKPTMKDFPTHKQSKNKQIKVSKTEWNTGGIPIKTFDKQLKKNQLAAEQRRLRAELKKQKELKHQQIIINEKKIGTKAIKMMKQKDEEIQYLKQMIEKEKDQKAKIDKLYEQKKQQIQKERLQLIALERKIQKQGIKDKKTIHQIKRVNSPEKDLQNLNQQRSKLPNRSRQKIIEETKKTYEEPTQSQILHQKNTLRQKQIDYLISQRQNIVKGLPNINYTPTLIPLLSKASYKIISTHVSQIVELLIDDMLEQQVYLLEEIELEQAKQREEKKSKNMLNEYYDMINQFVNENDLISSKIGKYSTMNFTDVYKPKNYPHKHSQLTQNEPQSKIVRKIQLSTDFDDDVMEQILSRKERFVRFVSNFDEYKKSNMEMFGKCIQEIIDEAIEKISKELDKGSGEFVDIVFRNQFK